jgi:hypothetical protein
VTIMQELMQQYFRNKTRELIAGARQAICEHPGLRGGHREDILRLYLNSILPKRFDVGRGMVYGQLHRSRESDIVIWDAHNYPSLQLRGHNLFFAESVRAILEVKTRWTSEEFEDILSKCEAARNIIVSKRPNLADDIAMLQLEVESLRTGQQHRGMVLKPHHIATGAIVFFGGASLQAASLSEEQIRDVDDSWPDALLLLEEGRVIMKHYVRAEGQPMSGKGFLEFVEAGEDALLIFTAILIGLITERSVQVEDPLYMLKYMYGYLEDLPSESIQFPLTRPVPGRVAIWP